MSFAEERREAAGRRPSRQVSNASITAPVPEASRGTGGNSVRTRVLVTLAIVLLVSLTAAALLASPPAGAQAGGAYISLSPISGMPGTEVTVTGGNFTANNQVEIYYYLDSTRISTAEARAGANGSFTATFLIPQSYTGSHTIMARDEGGRSASRDFTVKPGLTLDSAQGPVGTNVTVTGRGFALSEAGIELRYYLDGTFEVVRSGITANERGSWESSFQIPPSASGRHTIRARGDTSSLAGVSPATFDVKPGIMLDKSVAWPGQTITMTGNAFAADERHIKILFDGEELITGIRADERGHWQESFQVPEVPRGTYTVTTDGDPTGQEDVDAISFEVRPGLILSPDEGHVGMNTTVLGRGFAPDEDVVILYEGSEVATATTDDSGSFEVVFVVPESSHGARSVTAEDESDNEGTGIFTMESDPPGTPELLSPRDEGRAGFVGKVRPEFEGGRHEANSYRTGTMWLENCRSFRQA
jgi:hypothetical protein